ncbi:MAG: hypothetical protein CMK09_11770 [Ponticaulis sp.]|nr:hypothetical protein [Ponticaulis sp.]|tara:strand:+ start:13644 stop:13865 length:222 start_codon:yes stop_codon:yes gene_type:complete
METFVNGAVFGGAIAAVIILVGVFMRPTLKCSECGTPLPKFRKPASFHQGMWGGYTCQNCGAELDAKGQKKDA